MRIDGERKLTNKEYNSVFYGPKRIRELEIQCVFSVIHLIIPN